MKIVWYFLHTIISAMSLVSHAVDWTLPLSDGGMEVEHRVKYLVDQLYVSVRPIDMSVDTLRLHRANDNVLTISHMYVLAV